MSNEQKLIDAIFEIGIITKEYNYQFNGMTREEYVTRLATQLRELGFDTEPRGLSWGILKK